MHPIILGSPFLATVGYRTDVKNGKLSFNVEGDHMECNLFKASKFPSISDECHGVDVIDNSIREEVVNNVLLTLLRIAC